VMFLGKVDSELPGEVARFLDDTFPGFALPFLACTTDSAIEFLNSRSTIRPGRCVVLSRSALSTILSSEEPIGQLRQQILRQIPFRRLMPFTPSNPVEGAMFFGRETELEMLVEQDNVDYAFCGSGGIGKTSLMRQVQWVLKKSREPRADRIVEVDLLDCRPDGDAAAREIAQRVTHTSFSHVLGVNDLVPFFRRTKGVGRRFREGPIELFIDEVDEVLEHDRESGYPLLKALRHAKNQRLVNLTLIGRTETRRVTSDKSNPFYDRLRLVNVGRLGKGHSRDLLFHPLEHLGIRLDESDGKVQRELNACNGVPARIHHLGLEFAEQALVNGDHRR